MDPVFFAIVILWIVLFGMEVVRVRSAVLMRIEETRIRALIEGLIVEQRSRRDQG